MTARAEPSECEACVQHPPPDTWNIAEGHDYIHAHHAALSAVRKELEETKKAHEVDKRWGFEQQSQAQEARAAIKNLMELVIAYAPHLKQDISMKEARRALSAEGGETGTKSRLGSGKEGT